MNHYIYRVVFFNTFKKEKKKELLSFKTKHENFLCLLIFVSTHFLMTITKTLKNKNNNTFCWDFLRVRIMRGSRDLVLISPMFYKQLLHMQIPKLQKRL